MLSRSRAGLAVLAALLAPFLIGCPETECDEGRAYGGSGSDYAFALSVTADGGCIVAGETSSFGLMRPNAYVFKVAADGSELWQRTFGGRREDRARAVQALADGGAIVAGEYMRFDSFSGIDAYLFRTDANGKIVWSQTFDGGGWDVASAVVALDDGFLMAGHTTSLGDGSVQAYVVRTNADGATVWEQDYGAAREDYLFAAQELADGDFILAGSTVADADFDVLIIRIHADGSLVWLQQIGGAGDDVALAVQPLPGGGFALAGWTTSMGAGEVDAYLLWTDDAGNETQSHAYGGPDDDMFSDLAALADGSIVAAGRYTWPEDQGSDDMYLVRVDAAGAVQWSNTYGGEFGDEAEALGVLPGGGFVLAGSTHSCGPQGPNAYLVRTDAAGNVQD